ncbi:hypothetical protein C0Q70_11202 [Pomacea canaliculata]|uniref:G-protein coupled receptors family 1 profile domain-containing protein n=2 Tax=Pomacea canaliculata TaxID=400727 RepID=A0A2T7P5B0_POMCA|nr:uncharacterized protein LOC112566892 isoform X2 [Pomacea canaliculata]XP_025099097.1 uncharacterized protein LOC112566892 isoform X2 [Pomacea canaliculata]XP_025099098.1 uncharacterized protein LOC112566892 isoform X2 [Pomacea canaliculata]XP_025099099.1 uncharacterized protein LOC112566892 isoform X2 [Pomacea canaliculata]PVD28609.1 hypothetical protein C0Q70_11202 [Pomacea canaliculata]
MTVPKIKDFVDSNAKEFLSVFEVMAHFSDVSEGVLDVGSSSNDTINSTTTPLMTTLATNPACRKNEAFMQALPWVRITFGVLMVLENTLSLWALWHVRRLQRALQRFMSSLSVGELLTGIWCCYGYGAEVITGSAEVTFECRMRFIGMTYLNFASILSIAAMCLDRALALQCPLRYVELVTPPRVRLVLAVVWLLPLAVVLAAYVDVEGSSLDCDFVHIASPRTYVVLTVVALLLHRCHHLLAALPLPRGALPHHQDLPHAHQLARVHSLLAHERARGGDDSGSGHPLLAAVLARGGGAGVWPPSPAMRSA